MSSIFTSHCLFLLNASEYTAKLVAVHVYTECIFYMYVPMPQFLYIYHPYFDFKSMYTQT